jgi:hypothetical protein
MKKVRRIHNKAIKRTKGLTKPTKQSLLRDRIKTASKFRKSGTMSQYDQGIDVKSETAKGGYIELSEGFTIQWGRAFHKTGSDEQPLKVVFSKGFKNKCLGVVVNAQASTLYGYNAKNITNNGFEVNSGSTAVSDKFINYIAIGY